MWRRCIFLRNALTTGHTTDLSCQRPQEHNNSTSQCFQETCYSIIQLDYRRSNSHIHLFIKPTRTPLHYLSSSRHKLDAWATPVVQGYRVPVSNLPLLNRGNTLRRWETTRRPRGGEEFPIHTGFAGVLFLSRAAQQCSFFWGGGYHKVMLTYKEARRTFIAEWRFWSRIQWRFLDRDWDELFFLFIGGVYGGGRT